MADYQLPQDWRLEASTRPLAEQLDWSLKFLGIPDLWKKTQGEGIIIAFLDTGVDLEHPDLQGQVLDVADFTGSLFGADDRVGHGTWVAGACVARSDNDRGLTGLCPKAKALCYKVLGDRGGGTDQMLVAGIRRAREKGAHIISFSGGGPMLPDSVRQEAKAFIKGGGRFLFAAAGNDGRPNSVNKPAAWDEWIPVGACNDQGNLTDFTSRGPELFTRGIVLPGYEMVSTVPGGGYGRMSGTSMACPEAAGVAALLLARDRQTPEVITIETVEDLRSIMRKSATNKTTGNDSFALINPVAALENLDGAEKEKAIVWNGPGGVKILMPGPDGEAMVIKVPKGALAEAVANMLSSAPETLPASEVA